MANNDNDNPPDNGGWFLCSNCAADVANESIPIPWDKASQSYTHCSVCGVKIELPRPKTKVEFNQPDVDGEEVVWPVPVTVSYHDREEEDYMVWANLGTTKNGTHTLFGSHPDLEEDVVFTTSPSGRIWVVNVVRSKVNRLVSQYDPVTPDTV